MSTLYNKMFYSRIYELAEKASPQVAMDLGILAGLLSRNDNKTSDDSQQIGREALMRLAELVSTDSGDTETAAVDLDDAMDEEEDREASSGGQS